MARILTFVAIVVLLGAGFAWLADRPGNMVISFQGYQYQVSLMAAAVGVTAIVAAVMLTWWVIKSIWYSPYTISRYFRVRRRDRGYQALSTGMIAAGAGDAVLARAKNKEAAKLIRSDQEPLIQLLEAQSLLLEGDHESARQKFEQMIDDPETRLLGLRGLYLEAERLGDRTAARHYAGRAADVAPQLGWAADATIEEKVAEGDWDAALKLLDRQKGQMERAAWNRKRGVLLTGKAMALFDTDPAASRSASLEADKLLPDFAPAAVIAARNYFRSDEVRKGARLLEAAWKAEPHPDVADLYLHARHGDATHDRLERAKKLMALRSNNVESSLAVARAALDAKEHKLARSEAEAAIRMEPREAGYLLLADIEEAETGDIGRVKQWLARAVKAPRDPAWVADGVVSRVWAAASPASGHIDAFQWKAPVDMTGMLLEQDEPLTLPPARPAKKEDLLAIDDIETIDAEPVVSPPAAPEVVEVEEVDPNRPPPLPDDPGVDPDASTPTKRFRLF